MQHTRKFLYSISTLAILSLLALASYSDVRAADAKGANVAGTWGWTSPGRNGGPERKSTLKLKMDGEKLSGNVSAPGRDGQAVETAIEEGKITGSEIAFKVTREFNGNKMTASYAGKVEGDTIKGKIETEGRDGQKRSRDWEAKREDKK